MELLLGSIHALIKAFADIYHPVWEFLHGLVDEGIGHLFVKSIGHGACYGSKGIGVAAKSNGKLDAINIILGFQETDDGWAKPGNITT